MKQSTEKVIEFLKHHHMGILSTVSENGHPWGSAVIFAFDDDLNFFFMTRADTLKYKNIEQNPHTAFTIADEERQITVQAHGKISRVAAEEYVDVIFKKLAAVKPRGDFKWVPPVIKVHRGDYMILKFTPSQLQYGDFKQNKSDVHSEYIEQIL